MKSAIQKAIKDNQDSIKECEEKLKSETSPSEREHLLNMIDQHRYAIDQFEMILEEEEE